MSRPGFKAISVVALASVLTAVIGYCGIRASLKFGRLSIPPTYDDVVYFVSGAKWLSAWPGRSLAASLYALLGEHAPFSTITAVAGFLITPESYVGHYAINVVVVAGVLFGIAALVRRSDIIGIAICLIGVACFPLMVQVINEARTDLCWGLACGLAIGVIVRAPIHRCSFVTVAFLGFCCGLAALIKPSALPASLACFAAVFLVSLAAGRFDSDDPPTVTDATSRIAMFGLGAILALAPYLSVSFSRITGYIWRTLVENRQLWALDAGLYDHVVFYSFGHSFGAPGRLALGDGLMAGLGLFAARLALGAYLKSKDMVRALVLLAAVVVAYAIPSLSVVKSYFIGAMFYGTFIVATVLNFVAVDGLMRDAMGDRRLDRIRRFGVFRIVVMIALAGVFLRAMMLKDARIASTFDEATGREVRASSEAVWQTLRGLSVPSANSPGRQLVASFSSPYPVNPTLIELYAQRAQSPLTVRGEFFHPRLDEALKSLSGADIQVVTSSLPHNLPGPRMGDDIIQALDGRSDLCAIQTLSLPDGRVLRVYRKIDQGCSLAPAR